MVTKEQTSFLEVLRWSDDQCREYLEGMRWPDGPHCPKCGTGDPWKITRRSESKNAVRSLYRCRECKRQFTATVGTIFEDSKIPLNKWFAAIYLMCASKKGVSAHQLHRQLDVTYKSAWFMCHRVREAMRDKGSLPFTGTIEADETYIGGKPRRHPAKKRGTMPQAVSDAKRKKVPVFGMIERDGRVRTIVIKPIDKKRVQATILENIDPERSRLITDESFLYDGISRHLPHDTVRHADTYITGDAIHTQAIENAWSLLKRGIYGVFHHVTEGHLPEYLSEFDYRFNRRKVSDAERFAALMGQTQGRLLWFCRTPQPENPHA